MSHPTAAFTSPWRFWHGALILALAMTAYMALSWAHMTIVDRTIGMETYLGDGPRLPPSVLTIGQLNKALALLGVLWLIGLAAARQPLGAVGLVAVRWRWIGFAVAIGAIAFALRLGLAKLMVVALPGWLTLAQPPFAFDPGVGALTAAGFLVMTLLVTPFAEEVFYRGFLFKWMSGFRGIRLAAVISSVLFGVMHILPPQAISAFGMALVLCWLYWRTGSIWPAIVAHTFNNALGIGLGAAAAARGLPAWLTP